jgi:hypothetical protein
MFWKFWRVGRINIRIFNLFPGYFCWRKLLYRHIHIKFWPSTGALRPASCNDIRCWLHCSALTLISVYCMYTLCCWLDNPFWKAKPVMGAERCEECTVFARSYRGFEFHTRMCGMYMRLDWGLAISWSLVKWDNRVEREKLSLFTAVPVTDFKILIYIFLLCKK